MKKLFIIVLILCLFFASNFVVLSQETQEENTEASAKEVIYRIASLKIKQTDSLALQRAIEKSIKILVKREIAVFALRLKLNDFNTPELSGSIGPEEMRTALLILVKPFYSFLEKEYEGNLNLMIEECPGFSELLRLAERYSLTEDSSNEEVIVSPL